MKGGQLDGVLKPTDRRRNAPALSHSPSQLTGWVWLAAQVAWWALLALSAVVLLAAGWLDPSFASVAGWTAAAYQGAAVQLGISTQLLDAVHQGLASLTRLGFLLMGGLIYWRRGRDAVGWFTSIFLITFAVTAVFVGEAIQSHPLWAVPLNLLQAVGQACLVVFAFVFPDGRFVPRWTTWPTLVSAGAILTFMRIKTLPDHPVFIALAWVVVLWVFGAVPAQLYRYRHLADPIERQQIKWGVFGIFGLVLLQGGLWFIFGYGLPTSLPVLQAPSGSSLLYQFVRNQLMAVSALLMPIGLGIAVLRYRLWDIDVIIRRTLIYSTLSAVLALAYFGSVLVLESIFRFFTGQGQNSLVVVLSTLAIAALFGPLRSRVQRTIDRHFFRQKYDAARILAGYATAARDEVDLDAISAQLVSVVHQTMQPEQVTLWLRPNLPHVTSRPAPSGRAQA